MNRSLTALVATSLSIGACGSNETVDELAGETAADDVVDTKADGAITGSYTYYELSIDRRDCAPPACGGFFLDRLNRSSTICHDGASRSSCYSPTLDWSEAQLPSELQSVLLAAAGRGASSDGVFAIVRGRFASATQQGIGELGRFVVSEAWVAETDATSGGVFVRVRDNGVRCMTWPCPTMVEKALNTVRSANIHAIDWSAGGFDDDRVAELEDEILTRPWGVLIAGDRYTYRANNQSAKGRTATAAYRRLVGKLPD